MAKRLIKVAKELNVGTTTIVDHLKTKGFDLDNKPTAQVTDEMYAELNNAFQSSIAIKEKADQLVIGTRPSTTKREKDVVKIPPIPNPKAVVAPPPPPSAPKKKEEPAPPVKTNIKESAPKEVPVEAKTATTESNVKVSGKLKILGKIDLDSRKKGKPTAPKVVKPVEKVEAKVEPPKVKEEVVAPKAVVEPPKAAEPKVEAPVVAQKVETPPSVEKTPPVPKVEKEPKTPVVEKEPKLQEKAPVVKEEVKDKEAPKVVEAKQEVKKEEPKAPKAKVVKDKTEPAEKAKAPKKDKSERPKPKKGKVEGIREKRGEQAPTDTTESAADAPVGNKMVRAETPELRGLKIVGKIDTDQFKRKRKKKKKDEVKKDKPGIIKDGDAKSEDGDSRRKRRRTRKKITTEGQQQQEGGDARGGRSRTSDDRNRTGERSTSRTGGGGGDRSRTGGGDRSRTGGGDRSRTGGGERSTSRTGGGGDRSRIGGGDRSRTGGGDRSRTGGGERTPRSRNANRGRGGARGGSRSGGNRRDEIKEVSQKEIDDKIKATMARISGRGNKKRSRVRRENRERIRDKQELREQEKKTDKLQVTEFISVSELASLMDVAVTDVIMTCMNLGYIVSINQRLDAEIIELVGEDYGHEVEFISVEEHVDEEEEIVDDPADLRPRSPIVTVMGHVDHGKTSLLDYIRDANVADGEAGGITQHIGAYEVRVGEEKKQITFLDTPGHEAFTAMRARGAKVTDIAVIIISADDSIMPQTKEAISHAQAASVPMVFAINKIDKDGAQPERIKQELASMNLLVEEWGGKYQSQDISAKTGLNIDLLLEKIILEAEILELKANPSRAAIGAVLEASLDKGRGYVAKTLVQTGTLKIGDAIVAGEYSGKVKAMFNERGKRVKKAGPSTPVLVLGLGGAPQAGELFKVVDSEQDARSIASKRMQIAREQANRANKRISLDELGRRIALGTFKELNLIVKGDVDGSIEALSDSLIKLSVETVQVNVIHKAVGQIIESDVLLASASDAIIIGFQVRPSLGARKLAEREGVEIKTYSVIYDVIDEVKMAMEGMLEPTKEKKVTGNVEIREVYKISKIGNIAGCYVLDGKISRNSHVSVIRDGIVMYPLKEGVHGELASLKRYKDDIKEVKFGMECGLTVKGFNDIKVGDIVEAYDIVEIKQTLSSQKKR